MAADAESNFNSHIEQKMLVYIDYYMNFSLWIITCFVKIKSAQKDDMADINVILHNQENTLMQQKLDDSLS